MRSARTELESAVQGLAGRLDAEVGDGWRVRDVLAHLALWERVAVWKLTGAPVPGAEDLINIEPWSLDRFNDTMRERWRARPLTDVLMEFEAAHEALRTAVENAGEDACGPEGTARAVIDQDGTGHYADHLPALKAATAMP